MSAERRCLVDAGSRLGVQVSWHCTHPASLVPVFAVHLQGPAYKMLIGVTIPAYMWQDNTVDVVVCV